MENLFYFKENNSYIEPRVEKLETVEYFTKQE